jgi:Alcohol dehydrogenase GroES-like domain
LARQAERSSVVPTDLDSVLATDSSPDRDRQGALEGNRCLPCKAGLQISAGTYTGGPKPPFTPGYEHVGVVERLGQACEGLSEGGRVGAQLVQPSLTEGERPCGELPKTRTPRVSRPGTRIYDPLRTWRQRNPKQACAEDQVALLASNPRNGCTGEGREILSEEFVALNARSGCREDAGAAPVCLRLRLCRSRGRRRSQAGESDESGYQEFPETRHSSPSL